MKSLNSEEITNIGRLLLSPNHKNIQLALNLLQNHQYAIPTIKDEVIVFALFNPKETTVISWLENAFPNLNLEKHPIYPLAAAFQDSYYIKHLPDLQRLELLLEQQEKYESYIVADLDRAIAYEELARQIKNQYPENFSLVLPYFRKARKYLPNRASVVFSLAHALHYAPSPFENLTDYTEEVVSCYLKAYELHPLAKALYAIAVFYKNIVKNYEKATHYYKRCIEAHPNYPFAYNGWANLLLSQENYTKAKELALKGLELIKSDQNKEHILDSLGHIEWKGFKNYEKAEFYFSKAVEINPHHWKSIVGAADMFFEINDYPNAVKWYEVALNRQSRNITILKKLTYLYEKLEQNDLALAYYQKMLKIIPHFPLAMAAIKRLTP